MAKQREYRIYKMRRGNMTVVREVKASSPQEAFDKAMKKRKLQTGVYAVLSREVVKSSLRTVRP